MRTQLAGGGDFGIGYTDAFGIWHDHSLEDYWQLKAMFDALWKWKPKGK